VWQGLLANTNVGGENVHRGSAIGAILGARAGLKELPPQLIQGLYPQQELAQEINDFVHAVLESRERIIDQKIEQ
jgi:ADP-ribosyl-[dinitrogen reductase] hydrolase